MFFWRTLSINFIAIIMAIEFPRENLSLIQGFLTGCFFGVQIQRRVNRIPE